MELYEKMVKASGDGYNGKYRFLRTEKGWCLIGQGGGYLTPGLGSPIYRDTPEELLNAIRNRRPDIQLDIGKW